MPWVESDNLPRLDTHERDQVYNSFDCALTKEVWDGIRPLLDQQTRRTYEFELAMRAPAVEMSLRGMAIDEIARQEAIKELRRAQNRYRGILNMYVQAFCDLPFKTNAKGMKFRLNPNAPTQLKKFFYEIMRCEPVYIIMKGERKISTNREALEKLSDMYFHTKPFVNCILGFRDVTKQLSVLETEIDPDGRIRTTYNVAGTETGRWSSYASAYNTGTNLQNIAEKIRQVFVADKKKKMAYLDLEQAESRVVGILARAAVLWFRERTPGLVKDIDADAYLDACESGDLHTHVCCMVWPELTALKDIKNYDGEIIVTKGTPWGDDPKVNKAIAGQRFYREFSYRDMAKRGGHGTNYYGTPRTMAKHLKVPVYVMENFQEAYFTAFPCIKIWHQYVRRQVQVEQYLVTPFERRREFFARPDDDATLREAIAFVPQSVVGDLLNYAMWLVWNNKRNVELLAQVHDAIVFQFDESEDEDALLSSIQTLMAVPLTYAGRTMTIPSEAKTGWNWSKFHPEKNPLGLKTWSGSDDRRRLH